MLIRRKIGGTGLDPGITELTGDVTAGPGIGSFAATIADEAVTLAKMAHMATASILGRDTAATGDVEVLGATTVRSILNVADGADVGDVSGPGSSVDGNLPVWSGTGGDTLLDSGLAGDNIALIDTDNSFSTGQTINGTLHVTGKCTFDGLIDPTGLEFTPVAANPGGVAGNTVWIDSGDSRLKVGSEELAYSSEVGTGDVVGPASATDNAVAKYDTATGKLIQTSDLIIEDVASNRLRLATDVAHSIKIQSGDFSSGSAPSDNVFDAGNNVAGGNGAIAIGTTNASALVLGRSGITTTIQGTLALLTTLGVAQGGTGESSYTKGDIQIASASATLVKLGVGSNDQVLTADSAEASGVKWADAGVDRGAFRAYRSGDINLSSGAWRKVPFNAESFDVNSVFNTTLNRYIPQVEGYYQVEYCVGWFSNLNSGSAYDHAIYKNGTVHTQQDMRVNATSTRYAHLGSDLIYMNGTTDYLEVFMDMGNTETKTVQGLATETYFSGFLAVPA